MDIAIYDKLTPEQQARWSDLDDGQRSYWLTWFSQAEQRTHDRYYDADGNERTNYGFTHGPRLPYKTRVAEMTDEQLQSETHSNLYMAAMCAGNRRPCDWDWMVDECYDEMMRRTMTDEWYARTHKRFCRENGG